MSNSQSAKLSEFFAKRQELHQRKTGGTDKAIAWYDEEASLYDEQFENAGFTYPSELVATVNKFVLKKDARILDVAAGSGKVGVWLQKNGYTNIDALDGSSKMLELAEKKHVYQNLIHAVVGKKKIAEVKDASYDAICLGGSFGTGHVTLEEMPTMLRALRKDGFLIFSHIDWVANECEESSYEKVELGLEKLNESGMCTRVEKISCLHRTNEPGVLFILQRGDGVPE